MKGSIQLRHYLFLRLTLERAEAALLASLPLEEARLTDVARDRDELADIEPLDPAAGCAVPKGETDMPQHDEPADNDAGDFDPLVEMAADTLRGDLRDSLLDWFKAQPKSWPFMAEREQRDLADAADRYAGTLVKEACKIIAAGERPCIVATLVEYKEKDGVEAKLKLPSRGDVVAALHEACGREVLIVTSGAEEFMGQAADPEIDADSPKLPNIGEEYQDAA
jgi:hypothetical protein